VFYPDCRALDVGKLPVPLLMLLGGDDDMTRAAPCQEAATRAGASTPAKLVTYPGALHAFDVAELPQRMKYGFATIGHDPAAAAAARDEVARFLQTARGRRGVHRPIRLPHLLVGEEFGHRALVAHHALLENVDAIAQLADEADVLLGEHDREATALEVRQL